MDRERRGMGRLAVGVLELWASVVLNLPDPTSYHSADTTLAPELSARAVFELPDPTPHRTAGVDLAPIRELVAEADDLIEALEEHPEAERNREERRRAERNERKREAEERRRERGRQADESAALARRHKQQMRELANDEAYQRRELQRTRDAGERATAAELAQLDARLARGEITEGRYTKLRDDLETRDLHERQRLDEIAGAQHDDRQLRRRELAARVDDELQTLRERHGLDRADRASRQIVAQVRRAYARAEDSVEHSDARQLTHDRAIRRGQRNAEREQRLRDLTQRLADDVKNVRERNARNHDRRNQRLAELGEARGSRSRQRAAMEPRQPDTGPRTQRMPSIAPRGTR